MLSSFVHPRIAVIGESLPFLLLVFKSLFLRLFALFEEKKKDILSVFLLNNKNSYLTILAVHNLRVNWVNYGNSVIFLFAKIKKQ